MKKILCVVVLMVAVAISGSALADLNDGLVAYYPFEGNAKDESGSGNHGTLEGASLTADRFGNAEYAYHFDGNDYINCGNGTSLNVTGAISMVAWINPASFEGGRILSKQGSGKGYELSLWDNGVQLILNNEIVATKSLSGRENQWIFIAGTWDQSAANPNVKLYVDDEAPAQANFAGPMVPADDVLYIGCRYGSYGFFTGVIDEVRIYNRALTQEEVQELYSALVPPVADAGPDQAVVYQVTLDGSGSSKVGGTIAMWDWELVHRTNPAFNRTASGVNPTVTNLAPGFYDVILTVTDDTAATDEDTCLLAVAGLWDIDGDGKLGVAEIIYGLQVLAGFHP